MVLIEIDKGRKLLHIIYLGHVTRNDLIERRDEVRALIEDFNGRFRLLGDFSNLRSMDLNCREEIASLMEFAEAKGVEMVARVIPDASKDIGLSIMSLFHYSHKIRPVIFPTLEEAVNFLFDADKSKKD